jgi:hypothetical protein
LGSFVRLAGVGRLDEPWQAGVFPPITGNASVVSHAETQRRREEEEGGAGERNRG